MRRLLFAGLVLLVMAGVTRSSYAGDVGEFLGLSTLKVSSEVTSRASTEGSTHASTDASTASTDDTVADERRAARLRQDRFAADNDAELRVEIARGGGEHLGAIAHLLGCDAEATALFGAMAQAHPSLLESPKGELGPWLRRLVLGDPGLAAHCDVHDPSVSDP